MKENEELLETLRLHGNEKEYLGAAEAILNVQISYEWRVDPRGKIQNVNGLNELFV